MTTCFTRPAVEKFKHARKLVDNVDVTIPLTCWYNAQTFGNFSPKKCDDRCFQWVLPLDDNRDCLLYTSDAADE